MADDADPFPYMRWAKAHLTHDEPRMLGMSGLPRPSATEIPGLREPPPRTADGSDVATALRRGLAARHALAPDHVLLTAGTSHANFLAYLAFARGGVVVSETPAYEAFFRLGPAVGAEVLPFRRRSETAWRIDPDDLRRVLTSDARLVVLSNLHNPSGARLHPADLALVLDLARRADALVLVDEVYLDLDAPPTESAVHADPRVLVTNSLTKAHGLGDLRCGWILGRPDLLAEVDRWNDLVCPVLPWEPLEQALRALPRLDDRLDDTRDRAARLTELVDAWVETREDVAWTRPAAGFTGFLHLPGRSGDEVADRVWRDARVRVVPGSFFQMPDGLRVSYWLPERALAESLAALGRVLDGSDSTSA